MTPTGDVFAELEIAPTLDLAAIKRAYFAQVARRGPQVDGEGFRRIRAAYEQLSTPEGRAAAYLAAPVDVAAALAPLRERFDAPLASASQALHAARESTDALRGFVSETSRLSWQAALGRPRGNGMR